MRSRGFVDAISKWTIRRTEGEILGCVVFFVFFLSYIILFLIILVDIIKLNPSSVSYNHLFALAFLIVFPLLAFSSGLLCGLASTETYI